jgi:xylulokinase
VPTEELVLGIDCSTTACKAIAWDNHGNAHAHGRSSFSLEQPEPDGYEQNALAWWIATQDAIQQVTQSLGTRTSALRAMCLTHQRETIVVCDAQGTPLHPALVWMDARATSQVDQAIQYFGAETIHQWSGKPPCLTPSFYKLKYLFERHPDLLSKVGIIHDVHSFLIEKLCGLRTTSLACADPLGLIDMGSNTWSEQLLSYIGINGSHLPKLCKPGDILGTVVPSIAKQLGLPTELPVVAGAGDGQCAGLGAGISTPNIAYLNLGTALVSGVLYYSYVIDQAFRTLYAATPEKYFLETDLKGGTFTLNWLLEKIIGVPAESDLAQQTLRDLTNEAHQLPPGSDGLVLVPYWNGVMNPYWDDHASGQLLGLRGEHRPVHIFRAILEGLAMEQRLHSHGVEQAMGQTIQEFRVMGGGAKSDLWCQILADILKKPVVRTTNPEATCLGAGILAASHTSWYSSLEQCTANMTHQGTTFVPGSNAQWYDRLYTDVYQPLYPACAKIGNKLSHLRRAISKHIHQTASPQGGNG